MYSLKLDFGTEIGIMGKAGVRLQGVPPGFCPRGAGTNNGELDTLQKSKQEEQEMKKVLALLALIQVSGLRNGNEVSKA